MSVTIKDVAKAAGVSVATVSYVINKTRHVSAATEKSVLDAIERLAYIPNVAARNLKTGQKKVVAFVVPDISNYYFASIIQAVEEYLSVKGYSLLLTNTREEKKLELKQIKFLSSGMVDGIIVASTLENYDEYKANLSQKLPMVFVDRAIENCPCDTVILTDRSSIYSGTEALIKAGHKKIGYIAGLSRIHTTKERLNAYKAALADNGIAVDESLICQTDALTKSTVMCVQELLDKQCTAFVVSNSITTTDTLLFIQKNDAHIPSKPFILGYRNGEYTALSPMEIGTIVAPAREIGLSAAEMLLKRIKNPELPTRQIMLSSHLTLVQNL